VNEPTLDAAAVAGISLGIEAIAAEAIERARRAGADHAEAFVQSSRSFGVEVNRGKIETLKQSAARGLGLRVLVGGAQGFVSSNDLSRERIEDLARRVVALARLSTPDPANAFPAPDEAGPAGGSDLDLFDPEVLALPAEKKIEMAIELERVALAHDPRIRRTDGAHVTSGAGASVIANSHGLVRASSGTAVSAYVVPLADDRDGRQQSGGYGMTQRRLEALPPMETIALEAARRAVARIGARPVPTARVPVVMHPDIAEAWIGEILDAFSAESVIQKSSWLTEKLGETIASSLVTLVDDGRLRGRVGSAPHDGEGVATRRNVLIERGVCAMFLYDTYHARRAGTRSTGSAVRGYSSVPGIGSHNLYLEPGADTPEAILRRVDRGFYMDDQGSFGFNSVTGDYSFQAQGFWIERGEKQFPVDGVTVASNSLDMLRNVVAVGNDLRWEGSVASPTILIAEMTVSGGGA
jgi:PmbA protein